MLTSKCFSIFLCTPILAPAEAGQAFPQGGRKKTFPPWGKMKGGKKFNKKEVICYQNTEV